MCDATVARAVMMPLPTCSEEKHEDAAMSVSPDEHKRVSLCERDMAERVSLQGIFALMLEVSYIFVVSLF